MSADRGRDETDEERLDRNWDELLQELRITQTGLQLLSGFLLTLAFTQRFSELSQGQQNVYLALVFVAAIAIGVNMTPVMLHRRLYREHLKERVVWVGHVASQVVIGLVALLVSGVTALLFWVVVGGPAATVAGLVVLLILATLLGLVPMLMDHRDPEHGSGGRT